tara:strand:+ start:16630 stop:17100 length:471 start_codon:yes stop_codon:yes gene_type:complete
MKTTKRFDAAITKLYNALHNGTLNAMDCKHCAVGNLCDNSIEWLNVSFLSDWGGISRIHPDFKNTSDYSNQELSTIEALFIFGVKLPEIEDELFVNNISNWQVQQDVYTKEEQIELQFKGLCAVVEYLCELDNIQNVMEYQSLFEIGTTKKLEEII